MPTATVAGTAVRAPVPAPRTVGTALAAYYPMELLRADTRERWPYNGVQFSPFGCGTLAGGTIEDLCTLGDEPLSANISLPEDDSCVVFEGFVVRGILDFTAMQWMGDDLEDFVRQHTMLWRSAIVAREALNGALTTTSPSFLAEADTVTGGGGPVASLAVIENALADRIGNGLGMIHVQPGMLTQLVSGGAVKLVNGQYETLLGHRVVADAGYTGGAPSSGTVTAGTSWIYGSGPVLLRTTSLQLNGTSAEMFHLEDNTGVVYVSQFAVVAFDPCTVVATTASIAGSTGGGGGGDVDGGSP